MTPAWFFSQPIGSRIIFHNALFYFWPMKRTCLNSIYMSRMTFFQYNHISKMDWRISCIKYMIQREWHQIVWYLFLGWEISRTARLKKLRNSKTNLHGFEPEICLFCPQLNGIAPRIVRYVSISVFYTIPICPRKTAWNCKLQVKCKAEFVPIFSLKTVDFLILTFSFFFFRYDWSLERKWRHLKWSLVASYLKFDIRNLIW